MIGVDPADLAADFDPQLVSTGLEFLIIPLKNLAALRKAKPIAGMSQTGILAFCAEGYRPSHAFAARMFAPDLGVSEDAATGSANGCLAAYLVEHAYLGKAEVDAVVGQGFEISRPSALHLRASKQEKFIVEVGGQVNLVAQGEWLL
jgi:trans-2,3-dihydro-3-hydroxyanthranilate isomerase